MPRLERPWRSQLPLLRQYAAKLSDEGRRRHVRHVDRQFTRGLKGESLQPTWSLVVGNEIHPHVATENKATCGNAVASDHDGLHDEVVLDLSFINESEH